MTKGFWTCQRVTAGVPCRHVNSYRKQNCEQCGKRRPARRKPKHTTVLREREYDSWVQQYGEVCGICGRPPSARRRLDRDHDHASGASRGLLCARCNRALPGWVTVEWLEAAAAYLRRGTLMGRDDDRTTQTVSRMR